MEFLATLSLSLSPLSLLLKSGILFFRKASSSSVIPIPAL
jgi:hypothetical protein